MLDYTFLDIDYSNQAGDFNEPPETRVNANMGIDLNRRPTLSLYANNLFNERHKEEFMGDALGRRSLAKISYQL